MRAGSLRQGRADTVGSAGRAGQAERQVCKAAETRGQMSSWVGVQARLVGQTGNAGGSAGKVDKAEGLVGHANWEVRQACKRAEKLGRTCKKATGGRERHDLCSQGWTSTAGT
jgi:hypothetical protein